jgi:hypothetical protein
MQAARLALVIVPAPAVAACHTHGEPARASPVVPAVVPLVAPNASVLPAATTSAATCYAPPVAPGARLALSRSMCLGSCPDYRLEVQRDGAVVYEGHHFVRYHGSWRWTLPAADAERLFTIAACAGASSWKRRYVYPITDSPRAVVTLDLTPGAKPIEVADYPPCHRADDARWRAEDTPARLCELESEIDELSGVTPYVRCVGADGGPTRCKRAH